MGRYIKDSNQPNKLKLIAGRLADALTLKNTLSLDEIKASTDTLLEDKIPKAKAIKDLNSSLTKLETSTNSIDGNKSNSYDVSLEKNAWHEFTAQQDGIYEIVCYGDFIIFTNNKNHEHISLGSTTGFHEIFPFSGSLKVKKGQNVSYYIGSNLTIVSSKIYY